MNSQTVQTRERSIWFRDISAGEGVLSLSLMLGVACLALAWLVPGSFVPWTGFRREAIAGVGFVILACAALEHSTRMKWSPLALFASAVACMPVIQWATGQVQFRSDAFVCAIYISAFALSLCVGATLSGTGRRQQLLDALMICLVLVGTISTGLAFSQWLGPGVLEGLLTPLSPGARPYANMSQPNHLATLLFLGIAAVLHMYEQRRVNGLVASLASVWMGWGIVLTQSRTAWVAIAVLALWWLTKYRRTGLRLTGYQVGIACTAFAVTVTSLPALDALWSGPSESASPAVRTSSGTRPQHWATIWEALLRSPWTGYGWNQVAGAQFDVAVEYPAIHEWTAHSHNLILDLLIYNGLPIGLLIAGVLLVWFIMVATRCRTAGSWCLLLMLFALFTHALLEFPLHFTYFLLPAGLLMGCVEEQTLSTKHWIESSRLALALPTAALAVLATAIGWQYLIAEGILRDLAVSENNIGPPPNSFPRADWYFADGWAAFHNAIATPVTAAMPANDLEKLRQLARRYPYPNILERYAQAAVLNGRPDEASHALLHSCKVHSPMVCEKMRVHWTAFRDGHAEIQAPHFPNPLTTK
jgi:O-antigen ligase